MSEIRNIQIALPDGHTLSARLFMPAGKGPFPVLIFCHGFKGFQDWGFFPHMHRVFNSHGIALITFNFTHNGVDEENPADFTRLDLFAQNTISREIAELGSVVVWVEQHGEEEGLDTSRIAVGGHSRGAADAIVYAASDEQISNVVAWAPVSDYAALFATADKEKWKTDGYILVPNARTGQQMPVNYSFWQDLQTNHEKLDVLEAAGSLECGLLIAHGTEDMSVPIQHAEALYDECWHALLMKIEGADHTFNARHPLEEPDKLPDQVMELLHNTAEFLLD